MKHPVFVSIILLFYATVSSAFVVRLHSQTMIVDKTRPQNPRNDWHASQLPRGCCCSLPRNGVCLWSKSGRDTDGTRAGSYLFALVLAMNVWQFSIPVEFRRAKFCSDAQVAANPGSKCVTVDQFQRGIVEYYQQGGGIHFDFSIEGVHERVTEEAQDDKEYLDMNFAERPIALDTKKWPDEYPFVEKDFRRKNPNDDQSFYNFPRFVYHIDKPAVRALTNYYKNHIPPESSILDVCSSWVSHYPQNFPQTMKHISATGMNQLELQQNNQLDDYVLKDLNKDPTLPFDDNSFDVVTCVVSIDYLVKPVPVLKEVHRVLKPGGKMIISQSNRCFKSKAIAMWLDMDDVQHLELIDAYFKYAGGFGPRKALDITAKGQGDANFDPLYIIEAQKI